MSATRSSRPTTAAPNTASPGFTTMAEEVLAKAQSGRTVIQDFVPLAESLEWQLGVRQFSDDGMSE